VRLFSLKWLLFGFYILFGCLPLVGVSYLTTTNAGLFVSSMAQEQMEERSRLLAMQMNDRIYRQQRELLLLAHLTTDTDFRPVEMESYLQQMSIDGFFTFQQTTWHKGDAPIDESTGLKLKKNDTSHNLHFYINLPDQQGYIERKISLAFILAPLYSSMGDDSATYLLQSPDGKILWQSRKENTVEGKKRQPVIEVSYPVSRLGVLLYLQVPEGFLFDDINNQERKNLLFVGFVTLLATIAAFTASGIVSHKLKHIVNGTSQLAKGNFDYRIPKQSLHEMMLLVEMVNAMGEQLKGHKERVIQAEKLSSLGMFSVEVAHELKNPLAGMKASAQLLTSMTQKMDGQIDDILKSHDKAINGHGPLLQNEKFNAFQLRLNHTKSIAKGMGSEIDRLTELLQELLSFGKPSPPKKRNVSVKVVVESAIKTLYAQLQEQNLVIAVSLDQAITHVDALQVLQILINLLTNAVNAVLKKPPVPEDSHDLPASSSTFPSKENRWPPKTLPVLVDDRQYAIYGSKSDKVENSDIGIWITGLCGKNDDYSLIIKDKGGGIAHENLQKIFDPFFSIESKGHGLGLSIAQSLCLLNNIELKVQSTLGQGTTLTLHLYQSK